MKITTRKTHKFIELKVDEINTNIFESDQKEIKDLIENLEDVIEDLKSYIPETK